MIKIAIPRRSSSCQMCGSKFLPGNAYFSTFNDQKRLDYCAHCWQKENRPKYDCFWKSSIALKNPQISSSRLEKAFQIFLDQEEENEMERYILALYLSREKKIQFKKELKLDGKLVHIYESAEGDAWTIPVFKLTSQQVLDIQQQLNQKLQCNKA